VVLGDDGRVAEEYGTGPQGALRDPVRGYPPGPGQQGGGLPASSQPTSVIPAVSGPLTSARSGAQPVFGGAQAGRFNENAPYPGYAPDEASQPGRGASGSYPGAAGTDTYNAQDDYATRGDFAGAGGYGDLDQAPAPRDNFDRGEFAEFGAADDPYQDRYGADPQTRAPGEDGDGPRGPRRPRSGGGIALGPLRGKRLLLAVLAVIAVGIIGVAAYVFVLKPKSPASSPSSSGPLPTASSAPSQQACAQTLGIYCHIAARTGRGTKWHKTIWRPCTTRRPTLPASISMPRSMKVGRSNTSWR